MKARAAKTPFEAQIARNDLGQGPVSPRFARMAALALRRAGPPARVAASTIPFLALAFAALDSAALYAAARSFATILALR